VARDAATAVSQDSSNFASNIAPSPAEGGA
jgi:hypothetical protein